MARYRKVDPRIWNDSKFMGLSDDGKLIFFFLLTHPNMTALGAMRHTIPGMAAELGWKLERFSKGFGESFRKGLVKHDEKASFVWLPNFVKYNPPENPNVVKAWDSSVDLLPECKMLDELLQTVTRFLEGLPEGFRKPFRKGLANQEQEQEQEQKQDKDYCPELSSSDNSSQQEPPVMEFPLSRNGDKFSVFQSDIDQWQESFPGVDVVANLKDCRQWNIDNPQKRKTKTGIRNHISRWLGKVQNSGRGQPVSTQQKEKCPTCQYQAMKVCHKTDEQREKCTAWKEAAA